MPSPTDNINWSKLSELRRRFLDATAGQVDYWDSPETLELYDATFAQRIGWKWGFVLDDLASLDWSVPKGTIVDFGCGTGIAGRCVLERVDPSVHTLHLVDRSRAAVEFAARRDVQRFPDLKVEVGVPGRIDVLLISHVLTEMDQPQLEQLADLAATATSVIWVEPGTFEASLTLIAIRERLRDAFNVIAPCTHRNRCGILSPENERHWCHFFAHPPSEIFTDRFWSRFGQELEIDLRSLPLSYLVLDKRPCPGSVEGATRLIGRPNIFKPHAEVLACSNAGVCPLEVTKRTHPGVYRSLKKGKASSRVIVKHNNGRVVDWQER
jgi:SAM-dependent methyltransferase